MTAIALTVARKELVEAWRGRALPGLAAALAAVFLCAALVGRAQQARLTHERETYQGLVDKQWQAQPDRHPHRAAHYGSFAFRPPAPLSFFDFGVESYAGSSIYLEAHKQNTANFSEARHSTGLLRFGELTAAMVLQILAPLGVVFLAFGCCAREREAGTLALALSQGARPSAVLLGKAAGAGAAASLLFAPLIALSALLLWLSPARAALTIAGYALYLAAWTIAAVLVSSRERHARSALLVLLAAWVVCVVLMPRALPNAARRLYPAPSKPEFDRAIHRDVLLGGDGHDPQDARFARLQGELLAANKVSRLEDLPVNFKGVAMKAGEEYSSRVYEKHFAALQGIYRRQNSVSEWASLVNPYLAIRAVSMALAGSDYHHVVDFQRQAEAHRYAFVQKLNDLHASKITWKGDKEERLSRGHWSEFPAFVYRSPGLIWALGNVWPAAAGLLLWAAGLAWLLARAELRLE
jgi:ABC-2 type transport system permease protein